MRSALAALLIVAVPAPALPQEGGSALMLLPACRLYLQHETKGSRLLLERGVCLATVEAVLRLHSQLSAPASFCPPPQITLHTVVRVVVEFAEPRRDLDRPFAEIALAAYRQKWPC